MKKIILYEKFYALNPRVENYYIQGVSNARRFAITTSALPRINIIIRPYPAFTGKLAS
jgi:hypothetical protein